MNEYLIRRTDGDWFDLPGTHYGSVLRPSSFQSERVAGMGEWRIRCEGVEIYMAFEDPGLHLCFEGEMPKATADQIVREICENLERATGQRGRIVPL